MLVANVSLFLGAFISGGRAASARRSSLSLVEIQQQLQRALPHPGSRRRRDARGLVLWPFAVQETARGSVPFDLRGRCERQRHARQGVCDWREGGREGGDSNSLLLFFQ